MTIKINEKELIEMIGNEEYLKLVDYFAQRLTKLSISNGEDVTVEVGSFELNINEFTHLIYSCSSEKLAKGVIDFGFNEMYLSTEVSPDEYLDLYNKFKNFK